MDDKRQNLRRHIKAASDWLVQAEKSIESKNDVQGDLKIMLAKAELKNAEKHRKQTYLKKGLSLITALTIAFEIYCIKNVENAPPESSTIAFNETLSDNKTNINEEHMQNEIATESSNISEVSDIVNENAANDIYNNADIEDVETIEYDDEPTYEPEQDYLMEESTINEPTYSSLNVNNESNYVYESPQVINKPPEDMQKLMQSAGQILRAE